MEGDGWQVIMGQLSEEEKRKRGCIYCADIKKVKGCHVGQVYVKAYLTCPHDICPYADSISLTLIRAIYSPTNLDLISWIYLENLIIKREETNE